MNRPEQYKWACDVLYEAYFNNTLEHSNCYACAVGNLVANKLGIGYRRGTFGEKIWDTLTAKEEMSRTGGIATWYQAIIYCKESDSQINAIGYTVEEASNLEYAFEQADIGADREEWMFNGLVAVLEELRSIHEVAEDTQTERFRKHYQTKTLQPA